MSTQDAGTADVESMSKGELQDRVRELESWREDVTRDFAAMRKMMHTLAGTADDMEADLWDAAGAIDWLPEAVDDVDDKADSALSLAKTNTTLGESPTKKEIAKNLSKQEVVVDAIVGNTISGGAVTCTEVRDMAKPDTRLEHRTILDGWDELMDKWSCFNVDDSGEKKKLVAEKDGIADTLIRAVVSDLSDPQVTEKLNSYLTGKGV